MKIGRSTGYAILALGYVAQNQKKGKCVLSNDVSAKYKIPLEYLLKIMQQLVKAGIMKSKRGPNGGFNLARATKDITLFDVIVAIEGPVSNDIAGFEDIKKDKFVEKAEKAYANSNIASTKVLKDTKLSTLIAK